MASAGFGDRKILAPLSQNVVHDLAEDVGEAVAATLKTVGEAFVIDAEQVQDGGVQVVDVHGVFRDVVTGVAGVAAVCAKSETWRQSAAARPRMRTVARGENFMGVSESRADGCGVQGAASAECAVADLNGLG